MRVFKPLQSKRLFIHHAILAALLVVGPLQARAQVDLNLQSRLSTFAPPITVLQPAVTGPVATKEAAVGTGTTCPLIDNPNLPDLAAKLHNDVFAAKKNAAVSEKRVTRDFFIKHPEGTIDREKIAQELNRPEVEQFFRKNPDRRFRFTLAPVPITFKCGTKQPLAVKISFPFNPTYETNVLKSDANVHSDTSVGFGGSILVTGPGLEGRLYDVIAFSATSASARYSDFFSKSFDSVTAQGLYQIYLDARHANGTPIDPNREEVANLLTIDTLALGYVSQTAFMPGFHNETAELFTPQATLARQNIALGNDLCKTPVVGWMPTPDLKRSGFCYYLDLALTVGQTFSDVTTQQNANFAGSATFGWRVPESNWKITLPVVATARDYENVLGGRRDVLFQIGPAATYVVPPSSSGAPSFAFALAATYNRNYSTLATATWHGFVVQPSLTVAFQPEVAVKPDHGK
jgi:hypothetical protein